MANAPAIEVEQLRAGYGATVVVNGVDRSVAPGEFVALLGSSGCGKTTLLRAISGFQQARAGRVRASGATSPSCRRSGATWRWCSSPTRSGRT